MVKVNASANRIAALEAQLVAANERADMLEHQRCELESALHSSHRHVAHFRERAEAAEREMVDWRGEAEAAVDAAIQLRPMTERAEAAERERDDAITNATRWGARMQEADRQRVGAELDRDAARLERDEAVAAAAVMREALEAVQWAVVSHSSIVHGDFHHCPRCEAFEKYGHDDDCLIGTALASTAGRGTLAELRRLRAFAQRVRDIAANEEDDARFRAAIESGLDVLDRPEAEPTEGVLEAGK